LRRSEPDGEPKGEPESDARKELSNGVPRPLSGESPISARTLLLDERGVAEREKRGGVTYCCCSSGVAERDMGGRPRSLRWDGVSGTSSQASGFRKSGSSEKPMLMVQRRQRSATM
jgi:hypothetical protein